MIPTGNTNLQSAAREKLMRAIPFTEADVRLNDDGFFSEAQKERLKPKTDLYIALSAIGAFVGFVVSAIFFFVGQNSDNFLLPTLFCLIVFSVCFYAIFWSAALAGKIKRGYGVKKIEGFADLSVSYSGENGDIPVYHLNIGGVYFRLDEKFYDAFAPGNYRIFYFPLIRNEILSVEVID
jgi:hypothetical protein